MHGKLRSQALIALVLLVHALVAVADFTVHHPDAGLVQQQNTVTLHRAVALTALMSPGNAAGHDEGTSCRKPLPDDLDQSEDDPGTISAWNFENTLTVAYYTPGSENQPCPEPLDFIYKPPQYILMAACS